MRLAYFGSGYVGQVNAAVQASKGHDVILVDIREEVVNSINNRKPTIYEKGLQELFLKGNLKATTDYVSAVKSSEVIFICVGTPSSPDGSIDLSAIRSVSRNIGEGIEKSDDFKVVAVKSTVLPWVPEEVVAKEIKSVTDKPFGLVMNPEFLKEGTAVNDCLNPDSIVIGGDEQSVSIVKRVYEWSEVRPTITGIREASLVKYAKNSFLATKISFANTIANYCDRMGINSRKVLRIMSEDKRISPLFLEPGPGFGGSCFPKDVSALAHDSKDAILLNAVLDVNKNQYLRMLELAGDIPQNVAVLGLSFKPGTDDVRESPAIKLVNRLLEKGHNVRVYDPEALENAMKEIKGAEACSNVKECVEGADMVFIPVPWEEFRTVREYTDAPIIQGHKFLEGEGIITLGSGT